MDKNAIKKYAVWARRELIERVSQRAMIYGITAKDAGDPNAASVNGHLLSQAEKRQRQALIRNIKTKGYEQVMEEVAYTWFNRFAALRFMEVNGYLPSHIRVFTNDAGEFKPQILAEAIHLELDGLDMNKVYGLENANKSEELFKYLLIVQCNALNSILPGMFQKIEDYTELLLPDYLLREGSVIEQMVTTIPEEDWTDQVQIIGWLYEGYNTEKNELVYTGSMLKSRISKELLPAATTIFTPDWPIHYMVENSLGRLWLEGHPNDALKSDWKYYLDEAEQEPDVQAQLATIRKEYAALKPEEIRVIDPCQGSGHILCVLFDTLIRIYEDYGYTAREAAVSIVANNLWGLDIDDRASQLAYFSIMMKARQYDRRFFSRKIQPHVYAIVESNGIDPHCVEYFVDGRKELKSALDSIIKDLHDAKEYGSILKISPVDFSALYSRIEEIQNEEVQSIYSHYTIETILPLVQVAQAMAQRYFVVITNPPYLGSNRFSPKLDQYVKETYPEVKSDLSMVMYKHCFDEMTKKNGFVSFITTSSWMFLSSFEKLRAEVMESMSYSSLVDFGTELFEGKVGHNPIVSWVARKARMNYTVSAIRLVDYCYSRRDEKEPEFFNMRNYYKAKQSNFSKIPGSPIAYWVSNKFVDTFNHKNVGDIASPRKGLDSADNDRFVRWWFEPSFEKLGIGLTGEEAKQSRKKWFPLNSGGQFRKWYGNFEKVVNWENDGFEMKAYSKAYIRAKDMYFREGLSWTKITSGKFGIRYAPKGFVFDSAGQTVFCNEDEIYYLLGLLCSEYTSYTLKLLNPTINYQVGDVANIPVIIDASQKAKVTSIVKDSIAISKEDWDSFETSWDFKEHPLIGAAIQAGKSGKTTTIIQAFKNWKEMAEERFLRLKKNEEEINRIFIDIYGLSDELTSEVDEKDVTVRRADLKREVRSFISYAVGCMFGRYTIGKPGLVYAGGNWDASAYSSFLPDKDAIIPICDDEYFEDDIAGRFIKFVEVVYGKDMLEENLRFIADALGGKGSSRDVIRSYFINDFYADHLKVYQKRPIYWLFDSGKKNGFKCLIYMHRYQPDTIARIRTDYVHEQQSRYRTAIVDLEQRINGASTSERVKLSKQLTTLQEQAEEIRVYEEKIHHLADQMIMIDLDDGVKHNYEIFKDVLAKIK